MTSANVERILLLTTGPLRERLAGPEIRALEFAKALAVEYDVTLVAQRDAPAERDGLRIVPSKRHVILTEAARHDAILSPSLPPYLLALRSALGIAVIADQYDPHLVELVIGTGEDGSREQRTWAMWRALQLSQADLVLCASTRQRTDLMSIGARLRRAGAPLSIDPVIVPFGIPDAPSASSSRPLRQHFPQIAEDDSVVIWWGSVWRWLDATTAIRAFARIQVARPDVKLVITAGKPTKPGNDRFDATADAIALARELGVFGRSVLFLDDWIPYEERHDYLNEATLGLTLHRSSQEARLSARARYMDYLTAELPCVLGRGDEVAAEFASSGFATLVDRADPELVAETILALVDDPGRLSSSRAAGHRLAAQRQWSAIGRTLRDAVAGMPRPPRQGSRPTLELLAQTGKYYGRRAGDILVQAGR